MITKLEFHRYTLKPRGSKSSARAGALLRVSFDDLTAPGLSDLFPWPEFGDSSLETWFAELKSNGDEPSALHPTLRLALKAARDEAEAQSKNDPLVKGSILNHWLSTDPMDLAVHDVLEARRSMAPAIKIKIGKNAALDEANALSRLQSHWDIRLRLDANERMTREALHQFLDALPIRIRESIEFIEDPFAFDLKAWAEFHRDTGINIAYDRGATDRAALGDIFESGAAQVLIHKPAWQNEERAASALKQGKSVVVTSILGHPIGNLWAASRAAVLAPDLVHGCRSHVVYRDDEATLALIKSKQVRGARVVGVGIGHGLQSKWYSRLKWETLR